jgi:hypothetical protein
VGAVGGHAQGRARADPPDVRAPTGIGPRALDQCAAQHAYESARIAVVVATGGASGTPDDQPCVGATVVSDPRPRATAGGSRQRAGAGHESIGAGRDRLEQAGGL